jgi:hypothetical protein
MSCDFADDRVRNAERHQDRCSCVPQVVNADVLDARHLRQRAELLIFTVMSLDYMEAG